MSQQFKFFAGSSNTTLAHHVAQQLKIQVGAADVKRFSDGEVDVRINESVRAHDVFILQSTSYPGNDHLLELLLMIDAAKRASAARVTAVMPYFGYARQDRQTAPRTPISAKVVAQTLSAVGVDRLITIDIHAKQIQGFFDLPFDNVHAQPVLLQHLRSLNLSEPVVVAPDAGGVDLASGYAVGLNGSMALIDRRRGAPAKAKSMHLVGDVQGRDCLLVDDMIDTGGTLTEAADLLATSGARSVRAVVTHPILSGTGVERLNRSKISELITTDTVPLPVEKQISKISVISIAPLLAKAMSHVHQGASLAEIAHFG